MFRIFLKVGSGMRNAVSWSLIVMGVLASEMLYTLLSTKRERRIDRMLEDVRIAGHGNPAAGAQLGRVYLDRLKNERKG